MSATPQASSSARGGARSLGHLGAFVFATLCTLCACAVFPISAFGWSSAVHADLTQQAMVREGFPPDCDPIHFADLMNFFCDAWDGADTVAKTKYTDINSYDSVLRWYFAMSNRQYYLDLGTMHFEDVSRTGPNPNGGSLSAERQWNDLYSGTMQAVAMIDPNSVYAGEELLTVIGASLHKAQDFYAHTSWADRSFHDWTWFDTPDAQKLNCQLDGYGPDHQEVDNPLQNPPYYPVAYRQAFYASWQWLKLIRIWAQENNANLWQKACGVLNADARGEWDLWRRLQTYSGEAWKGKTGSPDVNALISTSNEYVDKYGFWASIGAPRPRYITTWERFAQVIFDPAKQDPTRHEDAPETLPTVLRQRWLLISTDKIGEAHDQHTFAIDSGMVDGAEVADFCSWITVNGMKSYQPMYQNRDDFIPRQWLYLVPIDPANWSLDIRYGVWDDDCPLTGDDHCNIAPGPAIDWTWSGSMNDIPSNAAWVVTTQGYNGEGSDNEDEAYVHLSLREIVNNPPQAVIDELSYVADEGEKIYFSAVKSWDIDNHHTALWFPGPFSFHWDFDGGDWDTGWRYNDLAAFTYPDDYNGMVTVQVWDGDVLSLIAESSYASVPVVVENVSPTVYAGPDVVSDGIEKPVILAGSFTDPGVNDTWTVWWDFGDGTTAAGSLVAGHTYAPGVYTAQLNVMDDDGGYGCDEVVVMVGGFSPDFHAVDDVYTVSDDQVFTITDPHLGVMANDRTIRGADAALLTQPTQGTVLMNPDGTFTFSPLRGGRTPVSFTYSITRGDYFSIGTVTINLVAPNEPPRVWDGFFTVERGATLEIPRPGLLYDASDPDDDALTAEIVLRPAYGTAAVNADGSFTYTPGTGRNTSDAFTFRAFDGQDHSNTATVYIAITRPNTSPETNPDGYSVDEDGALVVSDPTQGLLANDVDTEQDAALMVFRCSLALQPTLGTLTWGPDGTFTYVPPAGFAGQDRFIYWLDDGTYMDITEVTVDVLPVNDPPTITVEPLGQTRDYSDTSDSIIVEAHDTDSATVGIAPSGLPAQIDEVTFFDTSGPPAACFRQYLGPLNVPAGVYPVTFTASDGELDASVIHTVTVTPEDATVTSLASPVAVEVPVGGTASPTVTGTITQADDGHPGDLDLAVVKVSLVPVGPGATVTTTAALAVDASEMTASFSATFPNVPVNCYSITAWVEGGYFASPKAEEALTVFSPGSGFASGGGWFTWPGTNDKTTFGFVTDYVKGKAGIKNFKGSLVLIRHTTAGNHRLKSNAVTGLAVGETGGTDPYGWCSFAGKGTYAAPGSEPVGNHSFQLLAEDRNEPGRGIDKIWIRVKDGSGATVVPLTISATSAGAVSIEGGDIAIPHRAAGVR